MVCENEVEEVITLEYLITSSFLTKKMVYYLKWTSFSSHYPVYKWHLNKCLLASCIASLFFRNLSCMQDWETCGDHPFERAQLDSNSHLSFLCSVIPVLMEAQTQLLQQKWLVNWRFLSLFFAISGQVRIFHGYVDRVKPQKIKDRASILHVPLLLFSWCSLFLIQLLIVNHILHGIKSHVINHHHIYF